MLTRFSSFSSAMALFALENFDENLSLYSFPLKNFLFLFIYPWHTKSHRLTSSVAKEDSCHEINSGLFIYCCILVVSTYGDPVYQFFLFLFHSYVGTVHLHCTDDLVSLHRNRRKNNKIIKLAYHLFYLWMCCWRSRSVLK